MNEASQDELTLAQTLKLHSVLIETCVAAIEQVKPNIILVDSDGAEEPPRNAYAVLYGIAAEMRELASHLEESP